MLEVHLPSSLCWGADWDMTGADEDAERNQARGAMRKYQKWLGHWRPEYDSIKSENELVLMVRMLPAVKSAG